jgi:cell division protein FtsZ
MELSTPVITEHPRVITEIAKTGEELPVAPESQMQPDIMKGFDLAPVLIEEVPALHAPVIDLTDIKHDAEGETIHWELQGNEETPGNYTSVEGRENTVGKMLFVDDNDSIISVKEPGAQKETMILNAAPADSIQNSNTPLPAAAGGYLARPSNIYAEPKSEAHASIISAEEPVLPRSFASKEQDDLLDLQMQIVERDDIPAADVPLAHQAQTPLTTEVEDPALRDETEEQQRRAAERLHKLRNLSFNVNAADPNNEFETVPAYIRRNMELYNGNSGVENFYSNYEVKSDQNNQAQISTINTFLDGKKPD